MKSISVNCLVLKIIVFSLAILPLVLRLTSAPSTAGELEDIQAAINEKGARWTAAETSVSRLPVELRRLRVSQGELVSPYPEGEFIHPTPPPDGLPTSLDWRNYNGQNYVTPIKDQGNCGSCWAFATTAGLESYTLKKNNTPGQNLDLSEQVMVSCSGAGGCGGGKIDLASTFLQETGLPLESCYRYTQTNGVCGYACSNWQATAYKIDRWDWVSFFGGGATVDNLKNALYTYGPLPASMEVYTDFHYYSSGVYSYSYGSREGGHAVIIVGYNDSDQYFIVKNSWGTGWGESGYFRIAYSQLNSWPVLFGSNTIANICDVPAAPAISVDPVSLERSCEPGQNAASQSFEVWNSTTGTLNYNISKDVSWITSCSPSSGSSTGEHDTITVTYYTCALAPGTYHGTITITASGASNSPLTIPVTLTIAASLGDALDNHSLTFTTGGNAKWFAQSTTSYYGGSAAQSGDINDTQSSWLQTTITGPATLSFYKKVSSEEGYDFLTCYLDGLGQPGSITGQTSWQRQTLTIPAGNHTVKWEYAKDLYVSDYSDCAWIDKVEVARPVKDLPINLLLLRD